MNVPEYYQLIKKTTTKIQIIFKNQKKEGLFQLIYFKKRKMTKLYHFLTYRGPNSCLNIRTR